MCYRCVPKNESPNDPVTIIHANGVQHAHSATTYLTINPIISRWVVWSCPKSSVERTSTSVLCASTNGWPSRISAAISIITTECCRFALRSWIAPCTVCVGRGSEWVSRPNSQSIDCRCWSRPTVDSSLSVKPSTGTQHFTVIHLRTRIDRHSSLHHRCSISRAIQLVSFLQDTNLTHEMTQIAEHAFNGLFPSVSAHKCGTKVCSIGTYSFASCCSQVPIDAWPGASKLNTNITR